MAATAAAALARAVSVACGELAEAGRADLAAEVRAAARALSRASARGWPPGVDLLDPGQLAVFLLQRDRRRAAALAAAAALRADVCGGHALLARALAEARAAGAPLGRLGRLEYEGALLAQRAALAEAEADAAEEALVAWGVPAPARSG